MKTCESLSNAHERLLNTYNSLRALRPLTVGTETLFLRSVPARLHPDSPLPIVFPDYQRGHVWTDDQASRFIGFILEWGTAPVIFLQRWAPSISSNETLPDEVVDGKQRMTAICRWLNNEIPASFVDGAKMFIRDYSPEDQRQLTGPGGPTLTIQYVSYSTRAEVIEFYLRMNTGGTPHADEELDRVRGILQLGRSR